MSASDILLVDDQPSVCREMTAFLKNSYTVHSFTSGKEALDYLSGNPVDLVLLDYDMPGMTGYEVLMAIRLNKSILHIPVVFLTGVTNERMRQEMMGRGADDFLCKPVSSGDLHSCIEKHLQGRSET